MTKVFSSLPGKIVEYFSGKRETDSLDSDLYMVAALCAVSLIGRVWSHRISLPGLSTIPAWSVRLASHFCVTLSDARKPGWNEFMCQDSFDSVFDVLEELVSDNGPETVWVTTVSGRRLSVPAAGFVEDNLVLRSHAARCLLLKQETLLIHVDLDQVESVEFNC